MKKAIIGAGGFAREVKSQIGIDDLICFVDDKYFFGNEFTRPLSEFNTSEYEVVIAIGDPFIRYEMSKKLPVDTKYFTFIHPSAQILDKNIIIGHGSIICAGSILTTNIEIGNHCHLNLHTTIGHDCRIGDYFTTAPGVKVSGNCNIGSKVYIGTNASIKEKINICSDAIIGLNSGVVKDITESGTYIGTPSKKLK